MAVIWMLAGLVVFFAAHFFTTMRDARSRMIARLGGEGRYKGLYSLVALVGLVLIVYGFGQWRASGAPVLWNPPGWTRHLALALMLPATIAIVAAYTPPSHIKLWLKHPMLNGVKLWAIAHLLANGDLPTIVLAASFLLYAGYDRMTLMQRQRVVPGIATLRGDVVAVGLGLVLYLFFAFIFHPYIVGVPVAC